MIKAVLCDLDGVVYKDGVLLAGVEDALVHLNKKGIPIRFITNTSTRSIYSVRQSLEALGLNVDSDQIISPVSLALDYLKANNETVYPLINPVLKADFNDVVDYEKPDWVLIGDIGPRWNSELFNDLLEKLNTGANIMALHKNAIALEGDRRVLDIGSYIAALEFATNKQSFVLGKPSPDFFKLAVSAFEYNDPKEILMIGDDIYADILGGAEMGFITVFIDSGKNNPLDVQKCKKKPDYIFSSLAGIINIF